MCHEHNLGMRNIEYSFYPTSLLCTCIHLVYDNILDLDDNLQSIRVSDTKFLAIPFHIYILMVLSMFHAYILVVVDILYRDHQSNLIDICILLASRNILYSDDNLRGIPVLNRICRPSLLSTCIRNCCCSNHVGSQAVLYTCCTFHRKNLTCNGIQMAVYSNLELGHSLFCKLAHHKGHLSIRVDISYRHCRRKCNDSIHFASLVPRKPVFSILGYFWMRLKSLELQKYTK